MRFWLGTHITMAFCISKTLRWLVLFCYVFEILSLHIIFCKTMYKHTYKDLKKLIMIDSGIFKEGERNKCLLESMLRKKHLFFFNQIQFAYITHLILWWLMLAFLILKCFFHFWRVSVLIFKFSSFMLPLIPFLIKINRKFKWSIYN